MLMFPNIVAFLFFPNCQKQEYSMSLVKKQIQCAGKLRKSIHHGKSMEDIR